MRRNLNPEPVTIPAVFKAELPDPPPFIRDFLMQAVEIVAEHTARARLAAAREDYRRMMARVIPTPTYDAVVASHGFDPRMTL